VMPNSSNSTKSNPNTSYQSSSGYDKVNDYTLSKTNADGTKTFYQVGTPSNYKSSGGGSSSGGSSSGGFKFNYNALSYDDALKRAQSQLDPIYEKAIKNIQAQKYQDELNAGQLASARGLAHSGLAADLQNKVALTAQSNISNAEVEKSSKLAEMAQAMMERDQGRGDALRAQMFQEYLGQQQLGLQRDQFGYQKYRDNVADGQWREQFDYGKTRDANADKQWQSQFDYQKGRDTVSDKQWQSQFDYQQARDAVADKQWREQFDFQREADRDQRKLQWQQFTEQKRQFNSEESWRKYVYNNLSASEKAQLDWAKQQYGEDQAWRMFELEYNGNLQQSMAETEAGAYSDIYSDFLG
jgi:hypothetical protein